MPWAPVVRSVAIALVALLVYRGLAGSIRRYSARLEAGIVASTARRSVTLLTLGVNALRYALAFLALVMMLRELGFDLTPLLAGAGLAGLGLAAGLKSVVKDLAAGSFLVFEGQYAVGDIVALGEVVGTVEEVGLRVTRLRDLNGSLRYLPNGGVVSVTNYSQGRQHFILTVPLTREREAEQQQVVQEALASFQQEFAAFVSDPILPQSERLADRSRLLRIPIITRPEQLLLTQTKLILRLTSALTELGCPPLPGREPTLLPGAA